MQYLPSRNMTAIATPKIHKGLDSPIDNTPWIQSTSTNTEQYYSAPNTNNSNSANLMADADADVYMSDTSKSTRSRTSTTDMCVEKNTEGKPPYSYATLIKYAIERSSENKLTLSQIYQWVIDHYPYYGSAGSGWKNSIRHNLSLNKSFVRVPRPVNEPGKGSYWTVDQGAVDNEQRVRTNIRSRSNRSSSDSSLHRSNHASNNNDPWLLGINNMSRSFRDGRSLSTDAGATSSSASALRRTSQYGYCGHPYGGYERNFNTQPQYGYPNYHQYGQQRMPSHETLLSARQHSSVTYSLPASATVHHHSQSTPFTSGYAHGNNIYSSMSTQQPFYSHRQSCPDLTSISSANYPETNSILSNFNTTGNEVCLEANSTASICENKMMYTTPPSNHHFATTNSFTSDQPNRPFASSSSSSPIKGNNRRSADMSFFKDFDKQGDTNVTPMNDTPGLPSPVLSPSNCSSASSQRLSVVDPLSVVAQHPSPVTTTAATAASAITPGNKLTSPYRLALHRTCSSSNSVEECLTSPSSPLIMTNDNASSPMSTTLDGVAKSPVPFCIDSTVAYMGMVSQHHQQKQQQQQQQQQQQNASMDDHSLSSSSSQHSPQPSMEGNTEYQFKSHQLTSSHNNTANDSFLSQNSSNERFDYSNL